MSLQISNDIVEGIVLQGDHLRDTLQLLQDAVHMTKARDHFSVIDTCTHERQEKLKSPDLIMIFW